MEIKDRELKDLNAKAERAQARFKEGEKVLFRSDTGPKLFSDDEHRQRVYVLEHECNGVLNEVV